MFGVWRAGWMPPDTVSKVVREMRNNSYQVDLVLKPIEYGAFGLGPPLLELKKDFRWSTIARMIIVLTYPTSL